MKLSFDIDDILYKKITKAAKDNERSMAAEIRFQLGRIYGDKE